MPESTQKKLSRIRPPRVQITYDVEIGGAIEKKELPLVVGILADLSGKPDRGPAPGQGRGSSSRSTATTSTTCWRPSPRGSPSRSATSCKDDDSKLNVELKFHELDDFRSEPAWSSRSNRCASCSTPASA